MKTIIILVISIISLLLIGCKKEDYNCAYKISYPNSTKPDENKGEFSLIGDTTCLVGVEYEIKDGDTNSITTSYCIKN